MTEAKSQRYELSTDPAAIRARKWREANIERSREVTRKWRAANVERIKAYDKLRKKSPPSGLRPGQHRQHVDPRQERYAWDVLEAWVARQYPEKHVGQNGLMGSGHDVQYGIGWADFLGMDRQVVDRRRKRGWVDQWEADRIAISLGRMPWEIWIDWLKEPEPEPECDSQGSNLDSPLVQPES